MSFQRSFGHPIQCVKKCQITESMGVKTVQS